jgi:hypothetical protein
LYYIMLVALIIMSVFTLWLYQKNTGATAPDLAAPAPIVQPEPEQPVVDDESPFVIPPVDVEEAPIAIEPEPVQIPEEPVFVEPEPVQETAEQIIQPEPEVITEESSWLVAEPTYNVSEVVPTPAAAPAPAPIVNKPAYNVGGERNEMFTADESYESEYTTSQTPMCDDGTAPDSRGCCTGEVYTYMDDDGSGACCPMDGGPCFPPLQ